MGVHEHAERETYESERDLRLALLLTSSIFIIELIGGIISNSLALLSDAGHVFSDAFALALSWTALRLAARPPSAARTFGYHRTEVFAALINGMILFFVVLLIFREAYERILSPPQVKTTQMLGVAIVGLLANLWVVLKLRRHVGRDLNVKSALLHATGDAVSSIGVIVGAVLIMLTGYSFIDAAISVFIAIVILAGSLRLIRDSSHILLEGTPPHINLNEVRKTISSVKGVIDMHDLHVWSICSHITAASAHVVVEECEISEVDRISKQVSDGMKSLDITHTTLQFESEGRVCEVKP